MVCARCAKVISDGLWYIAVRVCVCVYVFMCLCARLWCFSCCLFCHMSSCPVVLCCSIFFIFERKFRHKFISQLLETHTFLQIHTYIHKHRKKKRSKQRAREIVHLSSPWIPLRYQPRESTFYTFWLASDFFFESFTPPPPLHLFLCPCRVAYMMFLLTFFL